MPAKRLWLHWDRAVSWIGSGENLELWSGTQAYLQDGAPVDGDGTADVEVGMTASFDGASHPDVLSYAAEQWRSVEDSIGNLAIVNAPYTPV